MPMLPLHVGWCLPLPITLAKSRYLDTQKLTSYLILKLTTHTLPYPKTQQKTHNPQRSCVRTGNCCRSNSRNREVIIWRLVSECAKKTEEL